MHKSVIDDPLPHSKIYRWDRLSAIAGRFSLISLAAVLLISAAMGHRQLEVVAMALGCFVIFTSIAIYAGSDLILRVEIEPDGAGILAWPLLGFRRQMRWSDVKELKFLTLRSPAGTSRPGVQVIPYSGRAITLSTRLSEWDDLVAELQRRVPRVMHTQ